MGRGAETDTSAEASLTISKGLKGTASPGATSSHCVGSTIVILSSYAVATMAMNCGKKIQEQKAHVQRELV